MKFYNFDTTIPEIKDALATYLKQTNVYYELSACFAGWHFEIKTDLDGLDRINAKLDEIYVTLED